MPDVHVSDYGAAERQFWHSTFLSSIKLVTPAGTYSGKAKIRSRDALTKRLRLVQSLHAANLRFSRARLRHSRQATPATSSNDSASVSAHANARLAHHSGDRPDCIHVPMKAIGI